MPPKQSGPGSSPGPELSVKGLEGFLCVSSLKERGRSIPTRKILWVLCAVPSVQAGSRQPADGVNGGAPAAQRGRITLGSSRADVGSTRRRDGYLGRWPPSGGVLRRVAAPSPATAGRGQPELGCRSSLRRARRHGAVRPQPGGLNQT